MQNAEYQVRLRDTIAVLEHQAVTIDETRPQSTKPARSSKGEPRGYAGRLSELDSDVAAAGALTDGSGLVPQGRWGGATGWTTAFLRGPVAPVSVDPLRYRF